MGKSKITVYIPTLEMHEQVSFFRINPDIARTISSASSSGTFEAFFYVHHKLADVYGVEPTEESIKRSIDYVCDNQMTTIHILVMLIPAPFHQMARDYIRTIEPRRFKVADIATGKNLRYSRFWHVNGDAHMRHSDTLKIMVRNAKKAK